MKRIDGAYCLIYDDDSNKVLVVKNRDSSLWSLPGGEVEKGETLRDGAIREAREETGLRVKLGDIVAINECFFKDANNHIVFFIFRAEIIGGSIKTEVPEEISEVKWMDIETANQLMPYYKDDIGKMLDKSAIYDFGGTI